LRLERRGEQRWHRRVRPRVRRHLARECRDRIRRTLRGVVPPLQRRLGEVDRVTRRRTTGDPIHRSRPWIRARHREACADSSPGRVALHSPGSLPLSLRRLRARLRRRVGGRS